MPDRLGQLRPDDPRELGGYRIEGRLGEGGMGTVFLARDPAGEPVAVKVIRPELAGQEEFRARFRGEVARARQVPSFCTAAVLDADPEHTTPYLVVEFVDGPSLAGVVAGRGPLTGAQLHGVAVGVATALAAIHGAGVVHRDLKPSNVLFARGTPRVIDFGVARPLGAPGDQTGSGQVAGSVAYLAPERFDGTGRVAGPAADVFSWGAVIAYAATGRAVFGAGPAGVVAARVLTGEPDLRALPESLRPVVARALAKDPDARPSAPELLDLLAQLPPDAEDGATTVPAGPEPRRATAALGARAPRRDRGRILESVLAVVLVALIGGAAGTLLLSGRGSGTDDTPQAGPPPPSRTEAGPVRLPAPIGTAASPTPSATLAVRPLAVAPQPATSAPPRPTEAAADQPVITAADGPAMVSGPYFIVNLRTGDCVDIPFGGPGAMDGPVERYTCRPAEADNQEWRFVPRGVDGDGYHRYWIQNVADDLCVDVPGAGGVDPGAEVSEMTCFEQDNQHFRLEPRLDSGGRRHYWLRNTATGMCLDVSGAGPRLTLFPCTPDDDHEWALVRRTAF
ncbi:protein kinase domain-containing protein [Catenuloplanes indicus]|uniref:Protein kinase domain-containing protein n=1 Tax=Catenuloplanes indicus TaxID=137267 RepID=A0AAE4AY76_9ACTN|nr:RICIN domain-containing protein [Catenuloplanes indicus]MDQ0364773.1 hypothetical protein [Catenuloplanes indicus]